MTRLWSLQEETTGPPAHTHWTGEVSPGATLHCGFSAYRRPRGAVSPSSAWERIAPEVSTKQCCCLGQSGRGFLIHKEVGHTFGRMGSWIPDPLKSAFWNGVSCSSRLAHWKGMSWYGFVIYLSDVHKWSKNNASFIEKREIKMPGIWPFQAKTCWDRADSLIGGSGPWAGPHSSMQGCVESSWLLSPERKECSGRFHGRR